MNQREQLLKRLASNFEPNWCGSLGCGGTHPDRDIYCACAQDRAADILETVEEFAELHWILKDN